MSEFFEIAYAAVKNRLCFFTGTGFSMAVTDGDAPSWKSLLEDVCEKCSDPGGIKASLFPSGKPHPLTLEESAQVIDLELRQNGYSIHSEMAEKISALQLKGDNGSIEAFAKAQSFRVVTTNYDKLMEELCDPTDCLSVTPGRPIPRSNARVKVYHVHGSVDVPENMVVTADDYFRFINTGSYFSRKLSTVLHENTVVIIGYSLGDTNLKAILSDYRGFSRSHVIGSNIILISRSKVTNQLKDYYAYCYGIRVLDNLNVHDFFKKLNSALPAATSCADSSTSNIHKIAAGTHDYKPEYLQLENSFYEIVSALSAIGLSINDPRVVSALGKILKVKIGLTAESGAWEQYNHLANWLIYLASILELKATSIEGVFLDATLKSMTTMSKNRAYGYSWEAFRSWDVKWETIISSNRKLIKNHILAKTKDKDAIYVVGKV